MGDKHVVKILKKIDVIVEFFVILSLCFYIIGMSLNFSNAMSYLFFSTLSKILIKSSFLLIILATGYTIITCQYNLKMSIFLIVLGILLVINYYFARDGRLLQIYCFCLSGKNINPKKILKVALISISFILIFVLVLRLLGIIPDIKEYMSRDGDIRYGLGFYVANVTGYHFLTIIILYIYLRREKIKLIEFIAMLFINFVIFMLTKTRNSFLTINMAVFLAILLKYYQKEKFVKLFEKITIVSYIIGSVIIFSLTILYGAGNKFAIYLNRILTGRLSLSFNGMQKFGITLLGQNISFNSNEYNVLDSSFINCIIVYGIIFFMIMLLFFTAFAYFSYKINDKYLSLCLLIIAYYSIFDGAWLMFGYNSFPAIFIVVLTSAIPSFKNMFYNREIYVKN